MTDSFSGLALFKGTSPEECETSVAAVRLRALEQGKHRDNKWMAIFTSGHLREEALYWYEDLEESIQNYWSRLRSALLARFGSRGKNPTTTSSARVIPGSTSSTTIPTPAAAPPTAPPSSLVRKGRVKVLNPSGELLGYISKSSDRHGVHSSLTTNPGDALPISFTPSTDGLFAIQINDTSKSPQGTDTLAITWMAFIKGDWINRPNNLASCFSPSAATPEFWDFEQKVWAISKDGDLSVEYPTPDGGSRRLEPWSNAYGNTLRWAGPPNESNVRIVFEDVI